MQKSYLIFFCSAIVWLPLGYVIVHLYDAGKSSNIVVTHVKPIAAEGISRTEPATAPLPGNVHSFSEAKELTKLLSQQPSDAARISPVNSYVDSASTAQSTKSSMQHAPTKKRSIDSFRSDVSWDSFAKSELQQYSPASSNYTVPNEYLCGADVVTKLAKPELSVSDYKWCEWALSPNGGQVKVGKSFGKLNGNDRNKFENLNCNAVATGNNPSCDDKWGDSFLSRWKRNVVPELCGDSQRFSSSVKCMDSSSQARFCVFENVMFDFSRMANVKRPGRRSGSRKWTPGFLSSHCDPKYDKINYFDLYRPAVSPRQAKCDYVINDTTIAYSHDDIHNLGHSMNDFMNVWAMMWLSSTGEYASDMSFLNIDAIRMGHNYHDELGAFGRHYELEFARVLKATDFFERNKPRVCFKRLIMQPRPLVLFTWDGWWQDMKCTFLGPSSLFQRWNYAIRENYGLLSSNPSTLPTNQHVQVLLIVRVAKATGAQQSSRVFANEDEIKDALSKLPGVSIFVAQDLATIPFEEQVRLVANSSLVIGMHGAGIPASMHMSVGTKHCCGVIEIFPEGEFKTIRGYGNMARRMGHHYERLALTTGDSRGGRGTYVPPQQITAAAQRVLQLIETKPSCVMPSVVQDPHFSATPSVWHH